MEDQKKKQLQQAIFIFTIVVCLTAIATGLGSTTFSNYFKEVYNVTSEQRGFIEIPRESPGILCAVIVSLLAGFSDVTIGAVSQILVMAGLLVMGVFSPSYGMMLIFLFIQSLGMHLFMPLNDAISMDLAKEGEVGKTLGHFKSSASMSTMVTAFVVFAGYRFGFFSFGDKILKPFVIAAVLSVVAAVLLIYLKKIMPESSGKTKPKSKFIMRKQYMPYYLTLVAYGCQKRIKLVFGPWIVIELMGKGADTVAMLGILTSFIGAFFSKRLGKMLDEKGLKYTMVFEGIYMMVVAAALGVAAGALEKGILGKDGWMVFIVYAIYILAYLLEQFNMVHAFMMRKLAVDPSEVTESLSIGLSIDHVLAITVSSIFGVIWARFGAEYVFFICAATALVQMGVGIYMGKRMLSDGSTTR
ncbi:MAG: MFS transporter [Coprococcus sp.]